MDGVLPSSVCYKYPCRGPTWVGTSFIRNKGQPTVYDTPWPESLTNNPPPVTLYVRVAPSLNDGSKMSYWINGWERPRLILTRGKKYQFNIMTCGYPFFFSGDAKGGQGDTQNVMGVTPTDWDMRTYTIGAGIPRQFYYQCNMYPDLGGQVVII